MSKSTHSSTSPESNHPDFNLTWVQNLLNDPDIVQLPGQDIVHLPGQASVDPRWEGRTFNSMFNVTLSHESGIRASLSFRRPCREPDAVVKDEDCYLVSLGTGLDGKPGRAHGGLSSLLLDQSTGSAAVRSAKEEGDDPPATATMTVDYKASIDTPCVILVRSWATELSGRKVWVKGVIQEDGSGKVFATAKALFVHPRPKASL